MHIHAFQIPTTFSSSLSTGRSRPRRKRSSSSSGEAGGRRRVSGSEFEESVAAAAAVDAASAFGARVDDNQALEVGRKDETAGVVTAAGSRTDADADAVRVSGRRGGRGAGGGAGATGGSGRDSAVRDVHVDTGSRRRGKVAVRATGKDEEEGKEEREAALGWGARFVALEVFGGNAMAVSAKPDKAAVVKRPFRASFTMKRTNDWVLATDVPSDVVVIVCGVSFALHKFPLVSRCGRIRMLVVDAGESDVSQMELPNVPGGSEGFDMAARFCYGINFEITTANVAVLRCAAEYLEMTEEFGEGNLIARTEAFLNEVVCQNLADSITVLHNCENLLPWAEELKVVSRTIDAIASKACREQIAQGIGESDYDVSGRENTNVKLSFSQKPQKTAQSDWWAEDLAVLRIDFYQRVLAAMRSRGLRYESIGGALMHYAHRSLKGLHRKQTVRELHKGGSLQKKVHDTTTAIEHEQRILVETIVSLLPPERNTASCTFLFGLLRTAIILDTTIACRLDLERRIGQQLEQATLDDLLIPSFSYTGDTLFDVDIVQRIIVCFLQQNDNEDANDPHTIYESDGMGSPTQSSLMKVAKLVDSYLAEVAPDANLKLTKFVALADLLPEYARVVDDGLYRAVDIYLKAHPSLTDLDRKKICKLMDVQKLSQEACTHAAQNERLPVQIMVQVLYFEQLRLRAAMNGSMAENDHVGHNSQRLSGAYSSAVSPRDNYASVRRENRELKLEVARMRMRLTDLEKDHVCMKQDLEKGGGGKSLLNTVSKKLTRLNPFAKGMKNGDPKAPDTPDSRSGGRSNGRRRRHSIS